MLVQGVGGDAARYRNDRGDSWEEPVCRGSKLQWGGFDCSRARGEAGRFRVGAGVTDVLVNVGWTAAVLLV